LVGIDIVYNNLHLHLWLLEGFFDTPETKEDLTNSYKIPEKLNPKAHDAYLLFQVFMKFDSSHILIISYT